MELKCPAMVNRSNASSDNQRIRVIQAQLKFLGYYGSHEVDVYENGIVSINNTNKNNTPFVLDNEKGNNDQSKTNKAIIKFKDDYDLKPNNSEITEEFISLLNINAPLPTQNDL